MKRTLTAIAVALCIAGCTETNIYYVTGDDGTEEGTDGEGDGTEYTGEVEEETNTNPRVGTYIFSDDSTLAVMVTVTELVRPYPCYISVFTPDYPTLEQPYWRSMMTELAGEWPDFDISPDSPGFPLTGYCGYLRMSVTFGDPHSFTGTVTFDTTLHRVDGNLPARGREPEYPDSMDFALDPDLDLGEYDYEVRW